VQVKIVSPRCIVMARRNPPKPEPKKINGRSMSIRARFDVAQTTDENRRHWASADGFSPDAALSPGVRKLIRDRSRYEVANNSYAKGIVLTLANDVVGTGPRLQMQTDDPTLNTIIEKEFSAWSMEVRLAQKLRTMRIAKAQDGEGLAVMITNEQIGHKVKLDLRLIESSNCRIQI